ncbi:hypothetical protein SCB49_09275 [unidentified eubacterium SCB49]|nr:hypothetical protein SCB49_09275 [unidentified eubacterium SCB49]
MKTVINIKTIIYITFLVIIFSPLTSVLSQEKQYDNTAINIIKKWELPKALNEVSGIEWVDDNTIVAVQDEDGIIFIYNLEKKKIIQEIKFAGSGDYEGITTCNDDAYVIRSDGYVFEIKNFRSNDKKVIKYSTDFSSKNNIETLTLNTKTNSLIVAPKDKDSKDDFKGLYEVPLGTKTRNNKPIVKIDLDAPALKNYKKKKIYKTFSPSDVAIHPLTGDYYILEGKKPKLLIMDANSEIKKVFKLDSKHFAQPEGITFSPNGTLYISNEAGKKSANIIEVVIK